MKKKENHPQGYVKTSVLEALLAPRLSGIVAKAMDILLHGFESEAGLQIINVVLSAKGNDRSYVRDILLATYRAFHDRSCQTRFLAQLEDQGDHNQHVRFLAALICFDVRYDDIKEYEVQIPLFGRLFARTWSLGIRELSEYCCIPDEELRKLLSSYALTTYACKPSDNLAVPVLEWMSKNNPASIDSVQAKAGTTAFSLLLSELAHKKVSSLTFTEQLNFVGRR